jgi:hypothetical protein
MGYKMKVIESMLPTGSSKGMTGIEMATEIRKTMLREKKVSIIAEGVFRGEQRHEAVEGMMEMMDRG